MSQKSSSTTFQQLRAVEYLVSKSRGFEYPSTQRYIQREKYLSAAALLKPQNFLNVKHINAAPTGFL
jgi:hypothetical protein